MAEPRQLRDARKCLAQAEAEYETEEGLARLAEGLALLDDMLGAGDARHVGIAKNLAATYASRLYGTRRAAARRRPRRAGAKARALLQARARVRPDRWRAAAERACPQDRGGVLADRSLRPKAIRRKGNWRRCAPWNDSRRIDARKASANDGGLQPLDEREAFRRVRDAHGRGAQARSQVVLSVDSRDAESYSAGGSGVVRPVHWQAVRCEELGSGAVRGFRGTACSSASGVDHEIEAWTAGLAEEVLEGRLRYTSIVKPGPQEYDFWVCVTHFFNHQTHHRGQVTALLSQSGKDYGVTDLIWLPQPWPVA